MYMYSIIDEWIFEMTTTEGHGFTKFNDVLHKLSIQFISR